MELRIERDSKIIAIYRLVAKTLIVVVIVTLGSVIPLGRSRSCGPFLSEPLLFFTVHPDLPISHFAAGQMGVLQPTYARSYLVVAYRYFSGGSFNSEEQAALDSVWSFRINGARDYETYSTATDAWNWRRLRLQYMSAADTARCDSLDHVWTDYRYYTYCQNLNRSTWTTASQTLLSRVKQYGASSGEVRSWVEGENILLDAQDTAHIPPLAVEGASSATVMDREYQNAVGYFYTEQYDVAADRFSRIANENSSPWQATAAYMIIRCHIRKGIGGADTVEKAELQKANEQIEVVERDARFSSMKDAAKRLLGFVGFRLEPEKNLHELDGRLSHEHKPETLFRDLIDYTSTLDRFDPTDDGGSDDGGAEAQLDTTYEPWSDGLTDWILNVQGSDSGAKAHSLSQWRSTKKALWLVPALMKAAPSDGPVTEQLIDAALKLAPNSPAYVHCRYHALRLMIALGKKSEARKLLDEQLSHRDELTSGAVNLFRNLRLRIDGILGDWLHDAVEKPVAITDQSDWTEALDLSTDSAKAAVPESLPVLDDDATSLINKALPLRTFYTLALSTELPADIRSNIVNVGWTRAYVLKNDELLKRFTQLMITSTPDLQKFARAYLDASSDAEREYAAIDLIAHAPGLELRLEFGLRRDDSVRSINDLRDNWWCAYQDVWFEPEVIPRPKHPVAEFLDPVEVGDAAREQAQLSHAPAAPNMLIRHLLRWADAAPNDPRIPEDLHRAVIASHLGCSDSNTTALSKAAWKLLHGRYKRSPWTKKTPYYY